MLLYKSEIYKDKELKYYITEKTGEFGEFGIYVTYGDEDWEAEAISSDLIFVINLTDKLSQMHIVPEYVQRVCEEALLEKAFIDIRRKNES